jgi:Fe-S cluster assembly iron-binding protein IscA
MALDEPEKEEKPVQANGVDILVADYVRPYVNDMTIDYIMDGYREGFVISGAGSMC